MELYSYGNIYSCFHSRYDKYKSKNGYIKGALEMLWGHFVTFTQPNASFISYRVLVPVSRHAQSDQTSNQHVRVEL